MTIISNLEGISALIRKFNLSLVQFQPALSFG